jgi:transcriptional regulator with XRE-family HTH domain
MSNDIVKQLRKIRRDKEVSQDSIAAIMGKGTYGYLSQCETGRRNPTLSTLCKWVDALGYEIVLREKQP